MALHTNDILRQLHQLETLLSWSKPYCSSSDSNQI